MRAAPGIRTLRLWIIACFAAVAAVIAALLVPMSAQASGVALSGVVTGATGKALGGVSVSAVEFIAGVPATVGTTTSSSTGAYAFASLPAAADYTLQFGASTSTYAQYLGQTTDVSSAQSFALVAVGSAHSTINASLAASGSISGIVKSITGAKLKGYTVRAFANGSDATPIRSAVTSSSGTYTITGLQAGKYQLEVLDTAAGAPYGPVYSGGSTSLDGATVIDVNTSVTTPFFFVLGKAGAISGVVTGNLTSGTQLLPGVTVTPYLLQGTSPSFSGATTTGMTSAVTNAKGAYSLSGLLPGYYTLEFTPGASTPLDSDSDRYGQSFLDSDAGYATGGTILHVVGGSTLTGRNEDLEAQASAIVNVTDSSSHAAIPNIQVTIDHMNTVADQLGDHASQTEITNSSGQVTFHGLGSGFYEVIIGSNTGAGGTISTYQREIVDFPNQLVSGQTDVENFTATLKDPNGLHTSTAPTLTCCGGPPYNVGFYIAVDPQGITWNDDQVNPEDDTIQWYRGSTPIPGATDSNYRLQALDAGQMISAKITGHDLAYGSGTAQSTPVGPIGLGNFYQVGGGGGVYGTEQVGQTLSYQTEGWSMQGVAETDVWQLSTDGGSTWNAISPQPTGSSYVAQPSDLNDKIRVDVTATSPGYTTFHYDTPAVTIFEGQFTIVTAPKITTTSTDWTMSSGTWSPNAGTTEYAWAVYDHAGNPVTLTLAQTEGQSLSRAGFAGDYVTVRAFREPAAYQPMFAPLLTAQVGVGLTTTGVPTFSGPAEYNTALGVDVPTFTPAATSVSHVWQYKSGSTWKTIAGATSATFTPTTAYIGRVLRVELTAATTGYVSKTLILAETTAVIAQPLTNTSLPSISGSVTTANTVSATSGSWSTTPSAVSFHWVYSATGLAPYKTAPGASTAASYAIPQSLLNQTLLVQVTASLSGHTTTTATKTVGVVGKGLLTLGAPPKATLTGTASTTEKLSFYGATFSPTPSSIQYDWYDYAPNNTLAIHDGSGSTYTIPTADVHDYIMVQAGGILTGYTSPTWGPTVLVKKGDNIPTGSLTISGNVFGSPITASGLTWGVTASTLTYQWQYKLGSTWKSISGATASSYTSNIAYLGKPIRLVETANATNYNSATVISTNSVTQIAVAALTVSGAPGFAPVISGINEVGYTLTVSPGTWSVAGATFTYLWQTSPDGSTWTDIHGATSTHLVVPLSAYTGNDQIWVLITASKPGYHTGSIRVPVSGGETPFEGSVGEVKAPVVTSKSGKLTVSNGTWKNATSYTYSWQTFPANGDPGTVVSTTNTYTPVVGDAGKAITVSVTANGTNYISLAAFVLARSGGPITATTPITVAGTPIVGGNLDASWTSFSVSSPTVTYQWYLSGKAISGATAQTYEPIAADVGKTLSVTVTAAEVGWTTEKFSAASTVTQSNVSVDDSHNPVISGSPTVDSVLTASQATWTETGVTVIYQWYRANLPIPGATTNHYTVTAADLGSDIYVEEIGSKSYQASDEVQGGPVTIGLGATLAPATPVKIVGTVGIGHVLSASYGAWNFPATLSYEWEYEAPASSIWNDITGATASTYTPTVADGIASTGHIRLVVHASRAGHTPVALTSAVVTIP